jgi:hypothetical protein
MKLYLHVGHGKTGSSALQSWLSLNAAALWNMHQIRYPETSPVSGLEETDARQLKFSMGNGFILHDILKADASFDTLLSLCQNLGPGGKLFFSREAFVPGALLALRRVSTLAPGLHVGLEQILD